MNEPICYTIGYAPNYDKHLGKPGFAKLGKTELYSGGCIWRTIDEVNSYLVDNRPRLSEHAVYIVRAIFGVDTVPNKHGKFHSLLVTSPITGKV